ncbi:MAG: potassium transporter TrkH [Bacteroidetes bacterium CG12_big_fil_rev_8_21_14_0_65_60_17]|nr:MAG: potassium transporter TrkH [Bacteroidetes bacterium CG12_big_fil_rev_8_21_14_0_65_60_17]
MKSPFALVTMSFAGLIVVGTLGLMVLPGLYTGHGLSWLDAFFTATSAVCVTGLIVVDTATYFTTAGQVYLLVLIQLGGIGIVTLATAVMSTIGARLSLSVEDLARDTANASTHVDYRRLVRVVVAATIALELVGAVLLWALWVPEFGWTGAIWPAVFHSVSAFCNAGFSIFSDSLMGFSAHTGILTVVSILIITGGVGFVVLAEIGRGYRARRAARPFRWSTHTQLVLFTSAILVVGGTILFTMFEWNVSLSNMTWLDRVVNGFFMSVTARTAGFNTIDYNTAGNNTDFLTIILMSIGGSPGSTAGGLKTTTAALIGLVAWSRIRGQAHVSIRHRTVPEETISRSMGLFVIFFGIVTTGIFLFTSTEMGWVGQTDNSSFLPFMFEAVSALNTVGLSMGVTADLSPAGRIVTIFLMFVGRVGPITVALGFVQSGKTKSVRFKNSYEDVGIG